MKNIIKKLIAVAAILTLMLCLAIALSTGAEAAGYEHTHDGFTAFPTDPESYKYIASGSYYLSADFKVTDNSIKLLDGTEVTLCLNGHQLDISDYAPFVNSGATLNICDCVGTGEVCTSNWQSDVYISEGGKLNIYGGNFTGTGDVQQVIANFGELRIYGGVFRSAEGAPINSGGKLYLSGTPSIATTSGHYGDIYVGSSGTIYAAIDGVPYAGNALRITPLYETVGYEIVYDISEENKDLFSLFSTEDDKYLVEKNGVLVITEIHKHDDADFMYTSASELCGDGLDSGNYSIKANITATDDITIASTCKVSICLNGYTIDLGKHTIFLYPGAELTICDCSYYETGKITSSSDSLNMFYFITGAKTLNINGGTYEAVGTNSIFNAESGVVVNLSNAELTTYYAIRNKGGTINIDQSEIICSENIALQNESGTINISGEETYIRSEYYGILNHDKLYMTGGEVRGRLGAISNDGESAVAYISGGKILGTGGGSKCINNSGTLYLWGSISLVDIDVSVNGKVYATDPTGELSYSGGYINVYPGNSIKHIDKPLVYNVSETTASLFGTFSYYSLELIGSELIYRTTHVHNWVDTWEHDDSGHWHPCGNVNCYVTDNTEKDGYAAHTEPIGRIDCTADLACLCGRVIDEGLEAHSLSLKGDKNGTHHTLECTNEGCAHEEDAEHTFDQEKAMSKYLKSESTCLAGALYYKSCTCGHTGTETFEYGQFDKSKCIPDETKYYSDGTGDYHGSYCINCGERTGTEAHTVVEGSFKTTVKYVDSQMAELYYEFECEKCGTSEILCGSIFYDSLADKWTLKTPATCSTGAIYTKTDEVQLAEEKKSASWEVENITAKNAENHTGTGDKLVSNANGTHNIVWSCCDAVVTGNVTCTAVSTDNDCTTPELCACGNTVTEAKSHTGGEANCEKLAHCADCGMEYGELDPAKHEKDTFIYEPNADGTTHIKKNECCGATAAADEVHTYGDNDKCVCGAEKPEEVTTTELIDDDTTPSETTPSVTTPSVTTPPPADEGCAGCSGSGFIGLVMLMAATLGTAIVIGKKK